MRRINKFEYAPLLKTVISPPDDSYDELTYRPEKLKVLETHKRPHNDASSTTMILQASFMGHHVSRAVGKGWFLSQYIFSTHVQ